MEFSRKARRELFQILLVVTALPLILLLLFGDGGFRRLRAYRETLDEARRSVVDLQQENRQLRRQIEKLKNDPREIERIAREDHQMARPGDIIIWTRPAGEKPEDSPDEDNP